MITAVDTSRSEVFLASLDDRLRKNEEHRDMIMTLRLEIIQKDAVIQTLRNEIRRRSEGERRP